MTSAPLILTDIPGKIYAVGDIHGCSDELDFLLTHLRKSLSKDDTLIFIGDYIDRGPDSKGVVDLLLAHKEGFPRTHFLRGNHEDMLLGYLDGNDKVGRLFLPNGGTSTFESYGIVSLDPEVVKSELPPEHLAFFEGLERYIVTKDHVFVHAGLHPLVELLQQKDSALFWIRDEFIQNIHKFDKLVVFGHTPYQDVMVHAPYKVGIDTGLVYGNKLTCVEFTTRMTFQIQKGRSAVTEAENNKLPVIP